ncbi:MAG: peptide/nickel transport system substrate-binding protein [Chloroflexota bacterium]|jgi:peptide/nickel transport system substrate-binding protein|nr:peptide/nickel transport system substrate-binding protein [Chloroflexota bacterium]
MTIGLTAMLTACAPAPTAQPSASAQQSTPGASPSKPGRTLVAAVRIEPSTVAAVPPALIGSGVATYLSRRMFNADLAILDKNGVPQPYLAEALPTLNTDDWKVFPDGRMETTYRLRPGVTWHDGTPLTSADFVFSWHVYATPDLGKATLPPLSLINEVRAPDDRTVVIDWKRPYAQAGALESTGTGAAGLPPLPRAILEPVFAGGSEALANHPFWTRAYVGLGPYRLAQWEPGAFLEGTAFENHVSGPPKIERIHVTFVPDGNSVLARMLTGDVQLSADTALPISQVPELQRTWGPDRGTAILHPNQWRAVYLQLRPDYVGFRPLLDPRVRKALAYAMDKTATNEAAYAGQALMSEIWLPPTSDIGRAIDAAIPKYPLDLRRSEEMMTQAGFARGADGVWTSPTAGRFQTELKSNASPNGEAEMSILASGWRTAGFDVQEAVLPAALSQDNEARAAFPGMFSFNTNVSETTAIALTTANMARPETRWTGGNRGGFSDAAYDQLATSLNTALDRSERTRLLVDMAKIYAEQEAGISLFFIPQSWVFSNDLRGPAIVAAESNMSWDIIGWELR